MLHNIASLVAAVSPRPSAAAFLSAAASNEAQPLPVITAQKEPCSTRQLKQDQIGAGNSGQSGSGRLLTWSPAQEHTEFSAKHTV